MNEDITPSIRAVWFRPLRGVSGAIARRAAWGQRMTAETPGTHPPPFLPSRPQEAAAGILRGQGSPWMTLSVIEYRSCSEDALSSASGEGYRVSGRRENSPRNPRVTSSHAAYADNPSYSKCAPIFSGHTDADFLPLLARFSGHSSLSLVPVQRLRRIIAAHGEKTGMAPSFSLEGRTTAEERVGDCPGGRADALARPERHRSIVGVRVCWCLTLPNGFASVATR